MKPRYMLDTNICIYIRRAQLAQVHERFRGLRPGDVVMSAITQGELLFGLEKIRRTPRFDPALRAFTNLIQMIPVVSLDEAAAAQYGVFRARLQKAGLIVGNNDLRIAAHAKALNITLATNNIREFERFRPDLAVEKWVEEPPGSAA